MAKAINTKIENGYLSIIVEGRETLTLHHSHLAPEIAIHAILHGCKQKIVDAAALPSGATLGEKYEAMREVFSRITSPDGTWNKQGEGNGQPTGLLFRALCRYKPQTAPDKLRAWLDKQDKTQQAALRKNPAIAAIIETIKAESAKDGGIDSDSLLSALDNI